MRADLVVPGLPRLASRVVDRSRLIRRLDRLAPITLVDGLRGLGKTTLAVDWVRHRSRQGDAAVWVNASSERRRGTDLLPAVTRALRTLVADEGLAPATANDLDGVLARLNHRLVLLALDDADAVTQAEAEALADLVARWPHLHLIAVTQHAGELRDAAHRHHVEIHRLGGGDLRITPAELPEYAEAWGHELTPDEARGLHSVVGGWLLPLRLVLDATPAGSPEPALHVAEEYFRREVVPDGVAGRELDWALRIALPEVLTLDLVELLLDVAPRPGDRVGGKDHSRDLLASLEDAGLIVRIPRRDGATAWRLPALVRKLLVEHLQHTHPEVAAACYRALAHAAVTDGRRWEVAPVLRQARAGADWQLLGDLWAQGTWQVAMAAPVDFLAAYRDISDGIVREHPALGMARTLARSLDRRETVASASLVRDRYLRAGTARLRALERLSGPEERIDVLLAAAAARRAHGRLAEALGLLDHAQRELAATSGRESRAGVARSAWIEFQRGVTSFLSADVAGCQEALRTAYAADPSALIAPQVAAHLAMVHAVLGSPEEARRWLARADGVESLPGILAVPLGVAVAHLAMDRLDEPEAERAFEQTGDGTEAATAWLPLVLARVRHAIHFGNPIEMIARLDVVAAAHAEELRNDATARSLVDRCRADLLLALGEPARVQRIVGTGPRLPAWMRVPAARLRLLTGEPEGALRIAAAEAWSEWGSARDRIDLFMVQAAASLALGRTAEATAAFRQGAALAQATGNLAAYLNLQPRVREELARLTDVRLDALHEQLPARPSPWPEQLALVALTPRETAVLRQMPHHDSVAGIARALSVSVNTVKKQLVSVYAKLGVHDRKDALLRAEQLGLLDGPGDA